MNLSYKRFAFSYRSSVNLYRSPLTAPVFESLYFAYAELDTSKEKVVLRKQFWSYLFTANSYQVSAKRFGDFAYKHLIQNLFKKSGAF